MTDRTHPDSVRITTSGDVLTELHDRIAELEQEVAHTDGLLGKANALASIRAHHIAELEAQLEAIGAGGVSGPLVKGFDAADMATASAQGFRDGAASLAASAGSEPVGYWDGEFSKDGGATIYEVPQAARNLAAAEQEQTQDLFA